MLSGASRLMSSDGENLNLGEAASRFLAGLSPEESRSNQQEIYKFVRWFGGGRPLAEINAAEVANYAERLSLSDADYMKKLELVRAFLAYTRKKGWSQTNLATHLKARKTKTKLQTSSRHRQSETVLLTREGYAELEAELSTLYSKRVESIDEIRKAAADKDFRENVPLAAAREQRSQLEGRIMKLEETLKSAAIIGEKQNATFKASIGDSVVLSNLGSGEELRYTIVSPSEVDPAKGKISSASPIGKAILGKGEGEVVEVSAPAGALRYRIKRIEH